MNLTWISAKTPPISYTLVQFKTSRDIVYLGFWTGNVWWDKVGDNFVSDVTHWRFVMLPENNKGGYIRGLKRKNEELAPVFLKD